MPHNVYADERALVSALVEFLGCRAELRRRAKTLLEAAIVDRTPDEGRGCRPTFGSGAGGTEFVAFKDATSTRPRISRSDPGGCHGPAADAIGAGSAHPARSSEIEQYVTDYMDRAGYPGVSIAITQVEDVLLTAGYGHDSTGADMTAHTPMPVASVSKSFTALAVMQLVESGDVALDEPVRSYLPDFQVDDPRSSKITVRELLSQTSGISDETLREKRLPRRVSTSTWHWPP